MPRWIRLLFQAGLTVGAVVALALVVEPMKLLETVTGASWVWIAASVLLLPLNLLLDGWVWGRLLDVIDGEFSPTQTGKAVLSGLSLGFWTPARLGEYAGRAFSFPAGDRWTISLSVFVQRMVDMAVGVGIGLVLLVGALALGILPTSPEWLAACTIGLATTTVLTSVIVFPARLQDYTHALGDWAGGLRRRTVFLRRLTRRHQAQVFGGTVARYFVFTGQFVLLSMALDPTQPLLALSAAVGLTFFAKYLIPSLTLLDLGIREGGAVLFFTVLGLDPAVGLSASLCLFSMNVLLPALIGIPFLSGLTFPDEEPAPAEEGVVAAPATDS